MVLSVGGSPSISGMASAHTLQAFIELVYVQTANNVLTSQMASLESALSTTQTVMNTLTQVQNLHNLVTVKSKGQFNAGYYSTKASVGAYSKAASAFFGTPVSVSVSYSGVSGGYSGFKTQMQSITTQLSKEITNLSATTPKLSTGSTDPNSLLAKLKIVLANINSTHAASTSAGAAAWVTDNYNATASLGVASAGLIQQNITNAITAGQSLNTTQTESVRNFLYIYEEYYKSASAVLQAITQVIQKMADNAGT
jgi:hypothetical protein